jgi:hypothetical protein
MSVVIGKQNGKKENKSCPMKLEHANLPLMMKKIFLTIASVALMSNSNVLAFAGGPFDNGDPGGLLMERGGFYQCQFSFRNGNGYGIFTPDSYLGGNLPNANQTTGGSSQQIGIFNRGSLYTPNSGGSALGHNANRSVFYYKGITYVGGCFGFVDTDAREIQGAANASSNETLTQQTLSQNTGGLINASQTAQTQQPIVINKSGNVLNVGWTGKITATRPIFRFRGKGEMTVDTGERTIEQYAINAYSGLLDAIVNSANNEDFSPTAASAAVADILNDLNGYLGSNEAEVELEKIPVRVTGSRRFF